MHANRPLLRAGFVLFLLALLTGLAIPAFLNPKMALAAHVTGLMNALFLLALGFAWNGLRLSAGQARLARGLLLFGTYTNWAATSLAAAWGTHRLTPIAAGSFTAEAWKESFVQVFQVALALAMVAGVALVVYGLRGKAEAGD